MPYLVRNLIAPSLIEDIRLAMLKLKLFIRSIYHKFSNNHRVIEWLLLTIASILLVFVVLLLSISVSDYLYGEKTTDIYLTTLRDLIADLALIIQLLLFFVLYDLVLFLQFGPVAWFILGVSWLFLLYVCYGNEDDDDDEDKPKK